MITFGCLMIHTPKRSRHHRELHAFGTSILREAHQAGTSDGLFHRKALLMKETFYTIDGSAIAELPFDPEWTSSGFAIKKYGGETNAKASDYSPNGQAQFNNERWYRYAELLLLYAEALIESGRSPEAMTIINNQIRARVGMGATPIADPMEALQHEKRVEMAFEPHRWFDIVRWGIGPEVFGTKWDPKFVVFPFPQSEIDRSKGLLEQNDGY
jgi:starch-binding outer membrane protein, SusD/RagB family